MNQFQPHFHEVKGWLYDGEIVRFVYNDNFQTGIYFVDWQYERQDNRLWRFQEPRSIPEKIPVQSVARKTVSWDTLRDEMRDNPWMEDVELNPEPSLYEEMGKS